MTLYSRFADAIDRILDSLESEGIIPAGLERRAVAIEPPRDPAHGDLATNVAMVLAKPAGANPRALAQAIAPRLGEAEGVVSVEIAGPGFLNLRLAPELWHEELATILGENGDYGRSRAGEGHRVNVEYVSANPTGPLHMGHCRGAVVGDSLARLLEAAGFRVTKEYY
ncbi:MAG TPA: arginine--tRNA ligase, partial [Sphingomonas sp.]|nr:arginine--tRNA ligase [Sphingomonas sp.]